MPQDTSCLYTVVRNISGQRRRFSFLPPHGRVLDPNQEFSIIGSLTDAIARLDVTPHRRKLKSFLKAVADGHLAVVRAPNPVLRAPNGNVRMLSINNSNNVVVENPCWTNSV